MYQLYTRFDLLVVVHVYLSIYKIFTSARLGEKIIFDMNTYIQSLYVRPSFTVSRLSRRNLSWSSHYSKSLSGYWMVFPAGGATMIDIFSMLIRGITITLRGDCHSGRLAALSPSIMLRNCPVNVIPHQNDVSALKHNCNVMPMRERDVNQISAKPLTCH